MAHSEVSPQITQFQGRRAMCPPARFEEGLRTDRRLYVHAICNSGQIEKIAALRKLGLW
jgi:hypothetical protein